MTHPFADVPGAYTQMYLVRMPDGDWPYLLDDTFVAYRPDGLWPFRNPKGRPWPTDFSPGAYHYSWSNERVRLGPSFWDDEIAEATLRLYLGQHGAQHYIVDGRIRLHLRTGEALIHPTIPDPVRDQAQMKADRLLAAVAEHRADRDAGADKPLTAWAYFHALDLADATNGNQA